MNELALFAGAGGGLLGSKLLGWRTICYVERDPYCVDVLRARIRDGYLDNAPIWDDVTTFDGRPWAGHVDIISAGFPCQPYSSAGLQLGDTDARNLWPDTRRIIGEIRPRHVLLENVARILSYEYLGEILWNLSSMGYCVRYGIISAAAVGAPQLRKRFYALANASSLGLYSNEIRSATMYRAQREAWQIGGVRLNSLSDSKTFFWAPDPGICRVADGLAGRLDRYHALGNGQVPAVVRSAWRLFS